MSNKKKPRNDAFLAKFEKGVSVVVLADSVNAATGVRLTTIKVVFHRFILPEFNTHRMFSRNFASSRAIPAWKIRQQVLKYPALPIYWGANQKGMQAAQELEGWRRRLFIKCYELARFPMMAIHWVLEMLGGHKQTINRLLEPWMWVEGVVTATEWENFFKLRCHPDAQPEFQLLANKIRFEIKQSVPVSLRPGEWHCPFLLPSDDGYTQEFKLKISAARSARVSHYLPESNFTEVSNPVRDVAVCDKLAAADPKHLSPFEHQAQAAIDDRFYANLQSWIQFRFQVE